MKTLRKVLLLLGFSGCMIAGTAEEKPSFGVFELEKGTALHPKICDVDKDGINDIVLVCDYTDPAIKTKEKIKDICWLKGPTYERNLIAPVNYRACGMAVADVNQDGFDDVIGVDDYDGIDENGNGKLFVFLNPAATGGGWQRTDLGHVSYAKDIETGDLNGDGLTDVAIRTVNSRLHLFIQENGGWGKTTIETPPFDGLAVADLDGDGDFDLVLNGLWFENNPGGWTKHDFDKSWYTQKTGKDGHWSDNNTRVGVADINGNGRPDIVISQSEGTGNPLTWYENPGNPAKTKKWKSHRISQQDHLHSLSLNDFNNDGLMDVMVGRLLLHTDTMENAHPVTIFYNNENGSRWISHTLSEKGCYGATSGDLDNDGDIDVVAPRNYERGPVTVFRNTLNDSKRPLDRWTYIQIDDKRGKWGDLDEPEWLRYFGLYAGDADRDGFLDLITGRYFYRNPGGDMSGNWERCEFGINVDAVLFTDVDGDNLADCIASAFPDVYWLEAVDKSCTKWTGRVIGKVTPPKHVNGQGAALAQLIPGGKPEILLSTGKGVVCIEIPDDPQAGMWPVHSIAPEALHEGIGTGDINGDGAIDISTSIRVDGLGKGVVWWENPGTLEASWPMHAVGETPGWADRSLIADMNGDGWNDIVVAEERHPGLEPDASLFWFENPGEEGDWIRHRIITQYSMNNLDGADLDGDGDIDLVTNEHKGPHQTQVLENDGNGNFTVHGIDVGHESHLGAKLFDMDNDGDLDMIGMGWDAHSYVHLWRNDANNRVSIADGVCDEGQACYKIETPFATFFLQKENGGFSSILDSHGTDWINFENSDLPHGPALAASAYRGMPNLQNRCEFKGLGHPGFKSCLSKILNDSTIYFISTHGEYAFTWTFTPSMAYLTMLKVGTTCPYWFLYEGTPGGKYDPRNQYWGTDKSGFQTARPDLLRNTAVQEQWNWIYFGNRCTNNVLVLAQVIPDEHVELMSYMGNTADGVLSPDGMVVFGFGRLGSEPQLTQPNIFVVRFIGITDTPERSHSMIRQSADKTINTLRSRKELIR